MGMRPAMIAGSLAVCLFMSPARAQTAEPQPPPATTGPAEPAPAGAASLSRSTLKAITYKTATTAANLAIFSVAAGGLAAGTALTAFGLAASVLVYTVNDYAWDSNSPQPQAQPAAGQDFDTAGQFWRTTKKFLTFKAATLWIKGVKAAAMYAYTGSSAATAAAISAGTIVNAGLFYANDFAWDYYDPPMAPPPAASPPALAPVPTVLAPALPQDAALAEHAPKS